jgi:hypothetical protein
LTDTPWEKRHAASVTVHDGYLYVIIDLYYISSSGSI